MCVFTSSIVFFFSYFSQCVAMIGKKKFWKTDWSLTDFWEMRIKLKKLLKKLVKELAYRVEPLRAFFHLTEKKVASVLVHLTVRFGESLAHWYHTSCLLLLVFFSQKKAKYKERPLLFVLVTFSILFVCLSWVTFSNGWSIRVVQPFRQFGKQ